MLEQTKTNIRCKPHRKRKYPTDMRTHITLGIYFCGGVYNMLLMMMQKRRCLELKLRPIFTVYEGCSKWSAVAVVDLSVNEG